MPKNSINDAKELMDKKLLNHNIENASYTISGYLNDTTPFYNISIEKYNETSQENYEIGTAHMNANSGEITYLKLNDTVNYNNTTETPDNTTDTTDNNNTVKSS